MGLEDILAALREESAEEVEQITGRAEAEAARILKEARERAEKAERLAASSRDAKLTADSEVVLSRASLNVERRLRDTSEGIYQKVLSRAADRLEQHRHTDDYPATLRALLDECLAFLPEARIVRCDPRDVEILEPLVARLRPPADLEPVLESWGGLELSDGRGSLVRNTLDRRFDRADAELRKRVGDLVPGLREVSVE